MTVTNGAPATVDRDELHAGSSEIEIRSDDPKSGLDRVSVLGNERPEVVQILDFAALEGQRHRDIPDARYATTVPGRIQYFM